MPDRVCTGGELETTRLVRRAGRIVGDGLATLFDTLTPAATSSPGSWRLDHATPADGCSAHLEPHEGHPVQRRPCVLVHHAAVGNLITTG